MSKRRHESEKSRPLLRMFCVVSTPDAYLFGLNRTSDFTESDKDVKKTCATHAGRMHAFFCAFEGAPKFRMFCKTFAGFWNKICVISTPRACFFGSERTIDLIESFGDAICFAQRTLAEKNSNYVREARRNSKNFAILS